MPRTLTLDVSGRKGCELCQQNFLWKYSIPALGEGSGVGWQDSPPSLSQKISILSPSYYEQEEDLLGFGQQMCAAGAAGSPEQSSRESEDPETIHLWLLILNGR